MSDEQLAIQATTLRHVSLWLRLSDKMVEVPPSIKVYNAMLRARITYDPRKQIELGYAVTTHKAQGSEFNTIVYCMSRASPFLLNRNNFYTAITRARYKVVVICDIRAMHYSLRIEKREEVKEG